MSEPISTLVNARLIPTVPVTEFDWEANNMRMQYISCPRHPNVKYLTKHPYARSLFFVSPWGTPECSCSISTMNVLVGESDD